LSGCFWSVDDGRPVTNNSPFTPLRQQKANTNAAMLPATPFGPNTVQTAGGAAGSTSQKDCNSTLTSIPKPASETRCPSAQGRFDPGHLPTLAGKSPRA